MYVVYFADSQDANCFFLYEFDCCYNIWAGLFLLLDEQGASADGI